MPIIPGNEPRRSQKRSGRWFSVIVFLILFLRPLLANLRSLTNGVITDQMLIALGIGGVALIVTVAAIRRASSSARAGESSYRPGAAPSAPMTITETQRQMRRLSGNDVSQPFVPSAPQYEPVITGKVFLAGVVLALLIGVLGLVLINM